MALNSSFYVRNAVIPHDFLDAIAKDHCLSAAEREVLSLAMDGKPTGTIAEDLGISGDAVRKRLSEVYQKFHISGRGPVKLTKLQQLLVAQYQQQMSQGAIARVEPSSQGSQASASKTSPSASPELVSVSQASRNQSLPHQASSESTSPPPAPSPEHASPPQHWGEAPDSSIFYGRESELGQLQQWIVGDRCRLVTVLGMAGIGKTALVVKLARQIQASFDAVVWLSLRQGLTLPHLLDQALQRLGHLASYSHAASHNGASAVPDLEAHISALIECCRNHRCLLVLDGAESILQSGRLAGIYRDGYEPYGELFKRIGQEPHQSSVILTSQEKPSEIALLEGETSPVRSLKLDGLAEADATQLLIEKGLSGDTQKWTDLIRGYRGNPLLLKMVATTIREVFDGNVTAFLKTTLFTHDISDYIEDIVERVSEVEADILRHMARQQQPIAMNELMAALPEFSAQDLIRALQSLKQRSLLETSEGRFSLPPAVADVVAQTLTD